MNTDSFKYSKINQREWDKIAEAGCEWTKPISHEKLIENKNNPKHEEEKNNEEKNNEEKNSLQNQYLSAKQKLILEGEAQKKESLKKLKNYYDNLFNNIINNWELNKENYENFFLNINPNIKSMLDVSCIVSNQENVILIFKFFCI